VFYQQRRQALAEQAAAAGTPAANQ
jgi:preprotein translocase subunit SecB